MILQKGDRRREKYLKDGNVLKKMRNVGGWAKGVMAGGIVLLVCALLIDIPFLISGLDGAVIFFGAIFLVPGLLMFLMGNAAHKKKMRNYVSYYKKATGFSEEEVHQVERELMEPDMVMFGNVPEENRQGASERNPQIACMITKNYFVAPFTLGESYIRRLSDMVLAAYSIEIPGIGGSTDGLIFLAKNDTDAYKNATLTRDVCREIIGTLQARKPEIITSQRFEYKGQKYDVLTDAAQIARVMSEG